MQTSNDKLTTFTDLANKAYGSHSYAAGYLASMVSSMIDEMRIRGTQDTKEMADYYERLLSQAIRHINVESK